MLNPISAGVLENQDMLGGQVSIKARFQALREGFGYVGKVRKFQQPEGGGQLVPPPAGIGLI